MKLTESYLRGIIKQVMNEMNDGPFINKPSMRNPPDARMGNAADEYYMSGFDSIEEVAKRLGVDPVALEAFINKEKAEEDEMYSGMSDEDLLAELRKRKLAPRRK
jgi:hypothetical protein